jgi:hypothetical protein
MEPIVWVFIIIIGIGAIVLGIVGLAALIWGWWFLIPLIGACVGGFIGFLFGLGLVVIIGFFVLVLKK